MWAFYKKKKKKIPFLQERQRGRDDQGWSSRCPHMAGVMAFFFNLCIYVCQVFRDCDLLLHN